MAFDPSLPANNSPLSSSEVRNQFNGLKENLEQQLSATRTDFADQLNESLNATTNDLQSQIDGLRADSAHECNAVELLDVTLEDPPSAANLQQVIDKLNEVITALRRS